MPDTLTKDLMASDPEFRRVSLAPHPADEGRTEVRRCRRIPGYRAHSRLRNFSAGSRLAAALRKAAVRCGWLNRALLSWPGKLLELCGKLPGLRGAMRPVLHLKNSLLFYRAAVEEAGGWEPFRREFAMRVPGLCYHHIGAQIPGSWPLLTLATSVFEEQLRWLVKHGYTGISAGDWLAWLKYGTPLPPKPVLITFDDAYSDLVLTGIPKLREHGFKATLFLVSQCLGGASTWDAALGYPSRPLMNAIEVLYAIRSGVEVGSHTRTHRNLRGLPGAELRSELEFSRHELTRLAGKPVTVLAYPFGSEHGGVRACAREFYELAFGCKAGLNSWASNPHQLRRMFVHHSRMNFALQVKYGIDLHAAFRFLPDRVRTLWQRLVSRGAQQEKGNACLAPEVQLTEGASTLSTSLPECSQSVRAH
jgi:peptidoglycan/xylan/chitin deacetylase (PgdA/CDA1 family)